MKYKELTKKEQRYVLGIGAMTLLLFVVMCTLQILPTDTMLKRNAYGGGDRKEELQVTFGDKVKRKPITVIVEEQKYTKKQQKQMFQRCCDELDTLILGRNRSLDEVRSDLELVTSIPGQPVDIVWEVSDYEVINVKGELVQKKLKKEGTIVELRGTLSYEDAKMQYITNVNVFPPRRTVQEQLLTEIQTQIKKANKDTVWKSTLILPKEINGELIRWNKGDLTGCFGILILGVIMIGLIFAKHKQEVQQKKKMKEKQMMLDYPEIINQFVLLIGAGMTAKNVWKKVVSDYQIRKKEERYAYEEMLYTLREMQSGVPEGKSYERFGRRCGLPAYLKLGALLSQNLCKGSRGLTELLSIEAIQAFEERKALARRMGEEASTKLLMPMFLMLTVVLVIVIVPAFLSMQIQ